MMAECERGSGRGRRWHVQERERQRWAVACAREGAAEVVGGMRERERQRYVHAHLCSWEGLIPQVPVGMHTS